MSTKTRHAALASGVIVGLGLAAGSGCLNDAVHTFHGWSGGAGRFALVIEPARTAIEGTHFLLDTATGDVWRMESDDGRRGGWVRLGDAPADARPLRDETEEES